MWPSGKDDNGVKIVQSINLGAKCALKSNHYYIFQYLQNTLNDIHFKINRDAK